VSPRTATASRVTAHTGPDRHADAHLDRGWTPST
jgi:hypothetical protein